MVAYDRIDQGCRHDDIAESTELDYQNAFHDEEDYGCTKPPRSRLAMTSSADDARARSFRFHAWRRAAGNFSLIKHRRCDGHLLSMHQSGTHWLKYMLANALAAHHGTPPPRYNHANDIIGGPKDISQYPQLPRLISSHSIAHPLLNYGLVHTALRLPPYVVLVRDIRASLLSNYLKWRASYKVSLSDYLRGDPQGRRFNSDLWWAFRFLNAWGEVAARVPAQVTVIRYEDLQQNSLRELTRVTAAFQLDLSQAALMHGVASGSKREMEARDDPARPPGAVRVDDTTDIDAPNAADEAFFVRACAVNLRYDFGYDYSRWSADDR
jgi:Sulfotransferase domain